MVNCHNPKITSFEGGLHTNISLSVVADAARTKTFERIAAYDAAILSDTRLDEALRTMFYASKNHDQTAEGAPVLDKAFPGGVYSTIINASREQEIERVAGVIACLLSIIPETGLLADSIKELQTVLQKAVDAQAALDKCMMEETRNNALETLAKKEYVEKYNAAYHNACTEIGKPKADKLFPMIRNGVKKQVKNVEGGDQSVRAAA